MKVFAWIVGVPIAILLFMMVLGAGIKASESGRPYVPTEKEKYTFAASECWKSYERKSLSELEKRQIASMCEGLDATANK